MIAVPRLGHSERGRAQPIDATQHTLGALPPICFLWSSAFSFGIAVHCWLLFNEQTAQPANEARVRNALCNREAR
jgi:hypothetical protein